MRAGNIELFGSQDDGVDVSRHVVDGSSPRRLELDLEVGLGDVRVASRVTRPAQPRFSLALPRVVRRERGRALGGVASGIAETLDVDPTLIRLVFALLSFASGAGIAAYAGAWLYFPAERRAGAVAAAAAVRDRGSDRRRRRSSSPASGSRTRSSGPRCSSASASRSSAGRARTACRRCSACCSSSRASIVFFQQNVARHGGQTLLAPGAVAVGLLVVVGPWLWRLARERDAERAERIRTQEREDMAARVHDSVLQTLALIQREDDPRRVATLARRQERELRGWLYPDAGRVDGDSLAGAVEAAAAEVEELHGVRVELVRTGDCPVDERVRALALAAREAMANAARHAGVDEVAVFLDVGDDAVSIFVRDRGAGFDPDEVPADRRGIAESIRGRMERAGGEAILSAAPGEGTEVELRLARMSA